MFSKYLKKAAIFLLVLLVCAFPVMASEDLVDPNGQIPDEDANHTAKVYVGTFSKEVSYPATECYPLSYDVVLPQNGGIFMEYAVSQGAQVKAGDVLVRFSMESDDITLTRLERELSRMQEEYRAETAAWQEKITHTQAAADQTQDVYEKEQLEISAAILQVQMEQFCHQKQEAIDAKQQEVDTWQSKREEKVLTAPADGTVTYLAQKKSDDPIAAGELLVTLTRTDIRLLKVKDSATEFRYNLPVTITAGRGSAQKKLTGRVVAAEDAIDEEKRAGYAYILLDPGFESVSLRDARVTISTVYLENVLLADRQAVTQENGKSYVIKLDNGVMQRRGVRVGMSNLSLTWILGGVEDGETLLLN